MSKIELPKHWNSEMLVLNYAQLLELCHLNGLNAPNTDFVASRMCETMMRLISEIKEDHEKDEHEN